MTVKTGQAWAGTFVTLDATGAKATPSVGPVGAVYVDGVADAASVTITGSNPYKFAVTLPSLTAGQRVDMYITATIATIATAAVIASEQADTYLTSDIESLVDDIGAAGAGLTAIPWNAAWDAEVQSEAADALVAYDPPTEAEMNARTLVAANYFDPAADTVATVTNLTNLPAVTTDWMSAAGMSAGAVTKIQTGLATPTNITAGTITTATNVTTVNGLANDVITAASIKTDAITEIQAGLSTLSAAQVNAEVVDALTVDVIADSVATDGSRPTIAQAVLMLTRFLMERSVTSTTMTVTKEDGATAVMTFTLDSATAPTAITRAS